MQCRGETIPFSVIATPNVPIIWRNSGHRKVILSIWKQQKQSSEVCYKKVVFRNFTKFTRKHLCQSLFFNKAESLRPATLFKKRLAQVFCCEFCEIFKNTIFTAALKIALKFTDIHLWQNAIVSKVVGSSNLMLFLSWFVCLSSSKLNIKLNWIS